MIRRKNGTNLKDTITLMAAAVLCLLAVTTSWADPDMGGGHNMGGHDRMGMDGDMSFGKHGLRPHNAAEHYLSMSSFIKYTDAQIKQLTTLRDEYIEKNATAEEQLKVAYDDLPRALYADGVDMKSVNTLLDKIGKLESQLWHAYAKQLHDIMAMLTPEQKKILTERWENAHHGAGGMQGDVPMHSGNMPAR